MRESEGKNFADEKLFAHACRKFLVQLAKGEKHVLAQPNKEQAEILGLRPSVALDIREYLLAALVVDRAPKLREGKPSRRMAGAQLVELQGGEWLAQVSKSATANGAWRAHVYSAKPRAHKANYDIGWNIAEARFWRSKDAELLTKYQPELMAELESFFVHKGKPHKPMGIA